MKDMTRLPNGQMMLAALASPIDSGLDSGPGPEHLHGGRSKPGAAVAAICRGQQIEEFNYQFEGGLYAQLINNPSFEELKNPIASWYLVKSGSSDGHLVPQTASDTAMLNNHQAHCLKLQVASVASGGVGVANGGYWGIGLKNNTTYKVSFWARRKGRILPAL